MDHLESLLGAHYRKAHSASALARPGEEPDFNEFYAYLRGTADSALSDRIESYVAAHPWAQDFVLQARETLAGEAGRKEAPSAWLTQAKALKKEAAGKPHCPHCGKPVAGLKKPGARQSWMQALWLVVAVVFFAASFLVPRYFMQFLAAAVLAAVKAIVERRAAKTQIMIYRALSGEDAREVHRLHSHDTRL